MFDALILALGLLSPPPAQDAGTPPPIPLPVGGAGPVRDVDGRELRPGKVPESTTQKARERWQSVLDASLPPGTERAPVTAFDLRLDLRYRASSSQTNDLHDARFQWLAPKFLRSDTGRGLAHLRGPGGSFVIDTNKGECVPVDVGRDTKIDRREIEEKCSIAANFARLTDPGSIRIRRLVELSGPPRHLPEDLAKEAQALVWLELETPDVFVARPAAANGTPLARVALGVNPLDQRVAQALVDDATGPAGVSAGSVVLRFSTYKPVDGFQVPHSIAVWLSEPQDPEGPPAPPRWMRKETMNMFLTAATLRAQLKPEDFLPPPQKGK